MMTKVQAIKAKIEKCNCVKLKSFCTAKATITRMKRQLMEWEKILAHHMSNKGLISKIYKKLIQLSSKKPQITWFKKWAKNLNRHFSKEDTQMTNRYVKRCSTSLILRKCKSKPQWRITSHLLGWLLSKRQKIKSIGKVVEKREPVYIVGGNVNWCSHYGKQYRFLKKLKVELPYDPAIQILSIYPKEMKSVSWTDIYTSMFIVPLFTMAKLWKQPKCPLMDEWIKKFIYIYTHIYIYAYIYIYN